MLDEAVRLRLAVRPGHAFAMISSAREARLTSGGTGAQDQFGVPDNPEALAEVSSERAHSCVVRRNQRNARASHRRSRDSQSAWRCRCCGRT